MVSRKRFLLLLPLLAPLCVHAQTTPKPKGIFEADTSRPLRYTPDKDGAFVIESRNGKGEFFNRPLYGSNTAFRVDAGDLPEFMFYLPNRGGNLRLGLRVGDGATAKVKWLHAADRVIARYRGGMMDYEIYDALLGETPLYLAAVPLHDTEGVVFRFEIVNPPGAAELLFAFGGNDGLSGSRRGDIGAEREPVTRFFQLTPASTRNNEITIDGASFTLRNATRSVAGITDAAPVSASTADAAKWDNAAELLASATGEKRDLQVYLARVPLSQGQRYLGIQRVAPNHALLHATDLANAFATAAESRKQIASAITINTPDPFINAAAPALAIAADACYDEAAGTMMHGAVAWRNKLLGWRGPYALDDLGWHDRALRHLSYWATQQNTKDDFPTTAHADPAKNLAADDWKSLHSNGSMSDRHYDMNLAYIDAWIRHALWTGDTDFVRKTWPLLLRHLDWEKRCFRRLFKGENGEELPLYEAYAAIWASDNLQYNGGGTTHASALNYYHHKMAAQFAKRLGEDPAPFEKEAALIKKGMNELLWVKDAGLFAEFKDLLGPQTVNPNPALWSFYHAVDCEVPDPFQAHQMSRYIDTQIAHFPINVGRLQADGGYRMVNGQAVHMPIPPNPAEDFYLLASSNWLPYTWSTNNVVLAENTATALAYFQIHRPDEAFKLLKGNILDSMFMGLCPGNAHMSSALDAHRAESQRDFADPIATTTRALVEGLFGIHPDLMADQPTITISPGFPQSWDHASIIHPDFSFSFKRIQSQDTYTFQSRFPQPVRLQLRLAARTDKLTVTSNGRPLPIQPIADAVGAPQFIITLPPAMQLNIQLAWSGQPINPTPFLRSPPPPLSILTGSGILELRDPEGVTDGRQRAPSDPLHLNPNIRGTHTLFARIAQGDFSWWTPFPFTAAPPAPLASAEPNPNPKFDPLDLSSLFNANLADIFKTDYLSPRSPYVSLAIPKQGIGGWADNTRKPDIDDRGIRALASQNNGIIRSPQGIPFKTVGNADGGGAGGGNNIAFTSFWDNHPHQLQLPLSGNASHLYLLMAGTTNPMRSRMQNGIVEVTYSDGTSDSLPLVNPTTWWPIDQDYLLDDFAFNLTPGGAGGRRAGVPPASLPQPPLPTRLDLKTANFRTLDYTTFPGKGTNIPGGAATLLDLPLNPQKTLKSLTIRPSTYEPIIGLLSATLVRP